MALNDAVRVAIIVIESYEMDIRNSEWTGVDLVAKGFCQGSIYVRARETIERIARGGSTPWAHDEDT